MYSWPPISQTQHVFYSCQIPPFSLPPLQNSPNLEYYSLVPLPREPKTLQTSPQMRIYDESNPNQYIEKNDDAIMKEFTKFLEENPNKISELSTSNIKVSYKISPQNELSLSFDFKASNRQNQDSITFVNSRGDQHKATKNTDIQYLEKQIVLPYPDSESPTSHIFTPQEVSMAIKKYVKTKGEIPTHNLIITTDENRKLSFEESHEKVNSGEYFVVKSINGNYNLEIGSTTKKALEKLVEEVQEDRVKACERALDVIYKEEKDVRANEEKDVRTLTKLRLLDEYESAIIKYLATLSKVTSEISDSDRIKLDSLQNELKLIQKEDKIEESRLEQVALRLKENSALNQENLKVWRERDSDWKPTITSPTIENQNIVGTSFSALSLLESYPTGPNSPSALSKINDYLRDQEREQEEEMRKKIANKPLILLKTELMKIKIRDIVKSMIKSPTSETSNEENYLKIQQEKENILYKILLVETAKDEKIKALLIDCLLENNTDKISKLNSLIFEKKILPTEVSSLDYVGENVIIKDLIIGEGLKLLDNYKKIGREFSDAVVNEEINRSNAIGENLDLAQNALNQFIEKTGITIATLQSEETKKNVQENLKMQRMNEAEIRASSFALELGINNSDSDFLQRLESAIERQKANQPQPAPSSPSTTSTPPALKR